MNLRGAARRLLLDFRRHQPVPRLSRPAYAPPQGIAGQPGIGAFAAEADVIYRDFPVSGVRQASIDQVEIIGDALLKRVRSKAGVPVAAGFDPPLGRDCRSFRRKPAFPVIMVVAVLVDRGAQPIKVIGEQADITCQPRVPAALGEIHLVVQIEQEISTGISDREHVVHALPESKKAADQRRRNKF